MIIYSDRIVLPGGIISGSVTVNENGKITEIREGKPETCDINAGGYTIIPGIIDTHNHGAGGYRFDTADPDEVRNCLKVQAAFGVTGIFPTTTNHRSYHDLVRIMSENNDGARILGIHSEGPWGSRVGEKGINPGYPRPSLQEARERYEAGEGKLVLFDIAPEVPGALEVIDYMVSKGVTVGNFHTNANYEEANAGIDHGITVATHLFNVMTGLHHRDVGTAGADILRDEVWCELICDGLHVSLPMVQLALRMKNHDQIMMVSDNGAFAGLPAGKYDGASMGSGGVSDRKTIMVTKEGYCLSETGRLTGSGKPVLFGLQNLVQKLHMPVEEAVRMSSCNPSVKYRLNGKGELREGNDFDAVIINDDFNVMQTFVEGRCVFDSTKETIPYNQEFIRKYRIE
ncbi:MAG: amidohydrolase family protein [Solobacterium sp.]|nr:amidohydrolase family protein [Solobacterium sp.]